LSKRDRSSSAEEEGGVIASEEYQNEVSSETLVAKERGQL